jgi:hypothetical protein
MALLHCCGSSVQSFRICSLAFQIRDPVCKQRFRTYDELPERCKSLTIPWRQYFNKRTKTSTWAAAYFMSLARYGHHARGQGDPRLSLNTTNGAPSSETMIPVAQTSCGSKARRDYGVRPLLYRWVDGLEVICMIKTYALPHVRQ